MTNEEIQQLFFAECEEALAAAEAGLMACRAGTADAETVNGIFRAVHSIKGGAGAFGLTALQGFTHVFETLLSNVRDGTVSLSGPLVALLLRAFDVLADHVAAAREGGAAPADAALMAELTDACAEPVADEASEAEAPAPSSAPAMAADALDFDLDDLMADMGDPVEMADPVEADHPAQADWLVRLRPRDAALLNGGEPLLLLRELERLGGTCVAVETTGTPDLDSFRADQALLAWRFRVPGTVEREAIDEIFDFVGDDCEVAITAWAEAEPAAEQTDVQPDAAAPAAIVETAAAAVPAAVAEPVVAAETAPTQVAEPVRAEPPAEAEVKAAAPNAAPAAAQASQSIRIELAKLDRLIDTVGELVIAQAMMAQRLSTSGLGPIDEVALLEGLTREIQESAMAIRAQPIQSIFSRVPRILRELEGSTGKRVSLEMTGESTELDKTVLERLGEPLTHLIRNAVDHGIEPADVRIAAGKPAEGVLRLSAEQRSGRILIKVTDDGRGIDRARVLAKAVERGLVSPDAQLTDEEIDNLIFAPGFSTAQTVSSVSGRGVGMDVVRQNVKDLGGRISIESRAGEGSTFTLALPLTLAIADGMTVMVGDQMLVVPLTHIVESLRPRPEDVAALGVARQMLNIRGRFLPVLRLDAVAGSPDAVRDPDQGVLIVVDTEAAGQAALLVDSIYDQRQFVIKSLETNYRNVPGISGATILGDGRVALIVDVDGLVGAATRSGDALRRAA